MIDNEFIDLVILETNRMRECGGNPDTIFMNPHDYSIYTKIYGLKIRRSEFVKRGNMYICEIKPFSGGLYDN